MEGDPPMKRGGSFGLFSSVSAGALFTGGLLSVPAFLLQTDVRLKALQAAGYLVLTILCRRKLKILPPVIAFLSILSMNLLTPYGRVVASVFSLTITEGALVEGIQKALTLVGLVYLSRLSIRKDLQLPGTFGQVIGKTFYYFEHLMEDWKRAGGAGVFSRLDNLLIRLESLDTAGQVKRAEKNRLLSDIIFVVLFAGCNWAVFGYYFI